MYIIQCVCLRKDKFTKEEAINWIREHGYSATKMDVTPELYRFRQVDPDRLRGGQFRTVGLGDVGFLIIAYF